MKENFLITERKQFRTQHCKSDSILKMSKRPSHKYQWHIWIDLWTKRTYHGDQEEVRGGDLLKVLRVSVSEPFYVNESQHHGTWGDAGLPEAKQYICFRCTTGSATFSSWKYVNINTDVQTWKHAQHTSSGACVWGLGRTSGISQQRYLESPPAEREVKLKTNHNASILIIFNEMYYVSSCFLSFFIVVCLLFYMELGVWNNE